MRDFLGGVLQETWYLLVIMAGFMALAVYLYAKESQDAPEQRDRAVTQIAPLTVPVLPGGEQSRRISQQERARAVIEQHEQRLEANPESEDAPALLHAMGNLARHKLGEYEQAAQYYEALLEEYPDWKAISKVYPQLATCYERMGDELSAQSVYKRMIKRFPEDSQEYQFARAQLGL